MAAYRDIPDALISALRDARHVCVLTGAGVSAESGVPTFREAQDGLWSQYDPQDLATPTAFLADPKLVWRWYRWRRELVADAQPNPGHLAIAQLGDLVPRLSLVTQNVDNLHQRAGSKDVVEFHGNLFDDRCYADGTRHVGDDSLDVPTCPDCGGHLRPGVSTATYFFPSEHRPSSTLLLAWPTWRKITAHWLSKSTRKRRSAPPISTSLSPINRGSFCRNC
jgi:NAD-dependent deacetylase